MMKSFYLAKDFEDAIENLRLQLAKTGMGITVQDHHLTLRLDINTLDHGKRHAEVRLLISEVLLDIPCCESCETPFEEGQHRYKVEKTEQFDKGPKQKTTFEICGECAK